LFRQEAVLFPAARRRLCLDHPSSTAANDENLLDNLEEAGMTFNDVVATKRFTSTIVHAQVFDEVYAQVFAVSRPQEPPSANCACRTSSGRRGPTTGFGTGVLIAVRKTSSY
jgi:hypothetical protein